MLNIVLVCQYGASTSILAENIKVAANNKGMDVSVNAYSADDLDLVIDKADIVLGGPQIRFSVNALRQKYAEKNVPIVVIDAVDYGMMNGKKVLETALKAIDENKG